MKGEIKYEKRIVAFVDILGFKAAVQDVERCSEIGTILKLPYQLRKGDWPKTIKMTGVMMTSISDSIIFSIKASERGAMNKIVRGLMAWPTLLLDQYGLMLRGGIAVGDVYHDDEVVFGPGLVKAYELESKAAFYPRILIGEEDLEQAVKSCSEVSQQVNKQYFVPDCDGKLFLDTFCYGTIDTLYRCLEKVRSMTSTDPRAIAKIQWMESYLQEKIQHQGRA